MCTGDNSRTATVVAKQLGIKHVMAETLPQGKYDLVVRLQSEGHVVGMIGDGINDSPALAQADLGVSLGAGTDIAMEAASIVLVQNDLRHLIVAIDLSRVTFRRICLNFVWAMGYNVLGIPIAAGVLFPVMRVRLPPELAALAMALSSVSVVVSSLLLRSYKKPVVKMQDIPGVDTLDFTGLLGAEEANLLLPVEGPPHARCCPCENCDCNQPKSNQPQQLGLDKIVVSASQAAQEGCCGDQGGCQCKCLGCKCRR